MQLTRLFTLLTVLGLTTTVVMAEKKKTPPTELRIGVKKRIPEEDCLVKAKKGDTLKMHYTGRRHADDVKFDSSLDRGVPFEFTLGMGQVIQGWDQGIPGMCIGEHRRLVFPADLGYGAMGSPPDIPPNAALLFDVELLEVNGFPGGPVDKKAKKAMDNAINDFINSDDSEKTEEDKEKEKRISEEFDAVFKAEMEHDKKLDADQENKKKNKKAKKQKKKKVKESYGYGDKGRAAEMEKEADEMKVLREANLKKAWEQVEETLTKLNKEEAEAEAKEDEAHDEL
ncbi:hypothetical protein BDF19DRAFT_445935 [Syncephalis fuscata]|nr:hypothetical protein BDF19DRAFT_445935 [Syncephalis fuscata]